MTETLGPKELRAAFPEQNDLDAAPAHYGNEDGYAWLAGWNTACSLVPLFAAAWEDEVAALQRERIAYYRALTTEGADVVRRVTSIVLDIRDQITDTLADFLAFQQRIETAETAEAKMRDFLVVANNNTKRTVKRAEAAEREIRMQPIRLFSKAARIYIKDGVVGGWDRATVYGRLFFRPGSYVAVPVPDGPCPVCGQTDQGQQGEYPCPFCGLPMTHDVAARSTEEVTDG